MHFLLTHTSKLEIHHCVCYPKCPQVSPKPVMQVNASVPKCPLNQPQEFPSAKCPQVSRKPTPSVPKCPQVLTKRAVSLGVGSLSPPQVSPSVP